jgi:hypothetical protein
MTELQLLSNVNVSDGVSLHLLLLGFQTLSMIQYSEQFTFQKFGMFLCLSEEMVGT